ncbi:hypothetical protein PJP10_30920, partial [Mycobacterium kansasii]
KKKKKEKKKKKKKENHLKLKINLLTYNVKKFTCWVLSMQAIRLWGGLTQDGATLTMGPTLMYLFYIHGIHFVRSF